MYVHTYMYLPGPMILFFYLFVILLEQHLSSHPDLRSQMLETLVSASEILPQQNLQPQFSQAQYKSLIIVNTHL